MVLFDGWRAKSSEEAKEMGLGEILDLHCLDEVSHKSISYQKLPEARPTDNNYRIWWFLIIEEQIMLYSTKLLQYI